MRRHGTIFLMLVGTTSPQWLLANESRDELTKAYSTQLQNSPSFFATAPVYHITPAENTITFAADYRSFDITAAPLGVDISTSRNNLSERLDMVGWALSPYVAFSTKNFGFGFAGETGRRDAHYWRKQTVDQSYTEQLGTATYSGIGLNTFIVPSFSFLPKFASPTLIMGVKSLNVVHQTTGELLEPFSTVSMQKYQYSVQNYEVGCNVSLKLVKRFTVIPWIDYSPYQYSRARLSTGAKITAAQSVTALESISADADLFWSSAPALGYGIDFAVNLLGLNIHVGGLMGILGTLNKGSDRIQDNSRTLSISIDMRAN